VTAREPDATAELWPDVAGAPEPVLVITGHHAVISNVRFTWTGARCAWCHTTLRLFSDGGTITAGISAAGRWYQTHRPAAPPMLPKDCPNLACPRPATDRRLADRAGLSSWIDGRWTLHARPAELTASPPDHGPLPAHPHTYRLLGQVWTAIRCSHPELTAAADTATVRSARATAR
jgi:hypothetical protein